MGDLDYTGAGALGTIVDHMDSEGLPLIIARPNRPVQRAIERAGLRDRLSTTPTVADAVKQATKLVGLGDELRAARGKRKDLRALRESGLTPDEVIEGAEETLLEASETDGPPGKS